MLTTESTLVRAFTKRRPSNAVAPPPAPIPTQEAFQRRQAALRQMGLLPALSLSQQEAQLDKLIPPTSPVDRDSEADRIKNEWVAKNNDLKFGLPPSPPLTPKSLEFVGDPPTIEPSVPPINLPPLNLILEDQTSLVNSPSEQERQPNSPISNPPESHLHLPSRSRSPSLVGSARSRSKSRTRAKSPLRFFTPALPPKPEPTDPQPQPPQRKKTVFSRFKRSNTVDPSSVSSSQPQRQSPSRSKSLFTSVKKSVFGGSTAPNNPSGGDGVLEEIPASMDPPAITLPTVSTTLTTAPTQVHSPNPDPDVVVVVEEKPGAPDPEPVGSSAEVRPDGLLLFPLAESESDDEKTSGKGTSIGLSLILNRERTKSASPSTPPASPLSSSFLSSPPASPTVSTATGSRLRGRLGRKGTIGAGSEALLSVWGGVTGLLGSASSVNGSTEGEERQALAPTIHNQASILHHMSNRMRRRWSLRLCEVCFFPLCIFLRLLLMDG
jgi:hypothetical protein